MPSKNGKQHFIVATYVVSIAQYMTYFYHIPTYFLYGTIYLLSRIYCVLTAQICKKILHRVCEI